MSERPFPQARLRSTPRVEMLARNAVSRVRSVIRFTWLEQQWELMLNPQAVEPTAGRFQVEANWGGARTVLRADAGWIEQIAQTILDDVQLSMLPVPMVLAVLEAALGPACEQLEGATGQRVQVVGAGTQALGLEGMQSIGWSLSAAGRKVSGELWLDVQGMQALAEFLPSIDADSPDTGQWGSLPVPLRFCIGWVTLPASTLRDTAEHDVILLDECCLRDSDEIYIQAGAGVGFRGRLRTTSIEVIEAVGAIMEDYDDGYGTEDGALDDIPVKLTFDLGERVLALADLQGVAPGYTFELGRDLRHAVTIRANGMVIGEGELVEIEDRIGVAVLRLRAPGQKSASMAQPLMAKPIEHGDNALALNHRGSRQDQRNSHAGELVTGRRGIAAAGISDVDDDEPYDEYEDQDADDESPIYASGERGDPEESDDYDDDEEDDLQSDDDSAGRLNEHNQDGDYEDEDEDDEDEDEDDEDEDDEDDGDGIGDDSGGKAEGGLDDEENEYEDDDEFEEEAIVPPEPRKSRQPPEPSPSLNRGAAQQASIKRPVNGNAPAAPARRVSVRDDEYEPDHDQIPSTRRPSARRVQAAPVPPAPPAPRSTARSREPIAPLATARRTRTEAPSPARADPLARRVTARDSAAQITNGSARPRPRNKTER
jgi:type III secretion protein Q